MIGDPAQFEAIGNRLGFRVVEESPDKVRLLWQGARFPAFLCLGIALLLLFISIPIVEALLLRGFVGPASSLWYFPLMNLVLFGISIYLITQRRVIDLDDKTRRVTLQRHSLYRSTTLSASYEEIVKVKLGIDEIESGFAVAGSTAAQKFPIPALRLELPDGGNVLLDRGSFRKLAELGKLASERIAKPLAVDPQLQSRS
jgi:hypothetical protein